VTAGARPLGNCLRRAYIKHRVRVFGGASVIGRCDVPDAHETESNSSDVGPCVQRLARPRLKASR